MKNLMQSAMRFVREEEGAVAIEYGLLATLVALAMAAGATLLGGGLDTLFTNVAACFQAPAAGGGGACPV